jgi:hypothetical protein
MAEVTTTTIYAVRFSEKEYKLVTKALGIVAEVPGMKATPDDRQEAGALNARLLAVMAADLRQKLDIVDRKRDKADPD